MIDMQATREVSAAVTEMAQAYGAAVLINDSLNSPSNLARTACTSAGTI